MRPTQAHYLRVVAQQASSENEGLLEDCSEYEKMLYLLSRHKKQLKEIQSKERKAAFKKGILPDYLPWLEGALSAGSGKQDNVLMTWLVWTIDCGEYHLALELADYGIFHDLALPDNFGRTLATLVAEEFADAAKIAMASQQPFDVSYLLRVEKLVAEQDMPDESRARLNREIGLLLAETQPDNALSYLETALRLNMNIGVKGEIKKLRKLLGKVTAEANERETNEPEPNPN